MCFMCFNQLQPLLLLMHELLILQLVGASRYSVFILYLWHKPISLLLLFCFPHNKTPPDSPISLLTTEMRRGGVEGTLMASVIVLRYFQGTELETVFLKRKKPRVYSDISYLKLKLQGCYFDFCQYMFSYSYI